MWIPNGFPPSSARTRMYDQEGRLKEFRVDSRGASSDDGSIAEANSLYATDAELFGQVAPFLKRAKIRDANRRNYIVQPGGAVIYFDDSEPQQLQDPFGNGRVQFTAPSEQETFGHNSMDGTKLAEPNGRAFTVGSRDDG